jgi:glycosyltransferase involved in cell wall biosynthesis
MTVIFFNPYADGSVTGASRRIAFLRELLDRKGIANTAILKEDYKARKKGLAECACLSLGLRRIAYFLHARHLCQTAENIVISEVIFTPAWRHNMILTVHDLKVYDAHARRGGWLRKLAYTVFTKLARTIIVVSKSVEDDLSDRLSIKRKKIFVIPNGISESRIHLAAEFINVPKIYDFIYVSSFVKHKRQDLLIRSAPVGSKICLVGRDMNALSDVLTAAALRDDEISVDIKLDIDSDRDLFRLIGSSRYGVFPSVFEGFGIPVLEYAAAGLTVIASDIPPFKELQDHVDIFVQPDDEVGWVKALAEAYNETVSPSYIAAQKVASSSYSEAAIAEKLTTMLSSKMTLRARPSPKSRFP